VGENMTTRDILPPDPVALQRLISEKLWDVRKATTDHDELAARKAESDLTALLDQLAACILGEEGRPDRHLAASATTD
jgi:hypothetical protein